MDPRLKDTGYNYDRDRKKGFSVEMWCLTRRELGFRRRHQKPELNQPNHEVQKEREMEIEIEILLRKVRRILMEAVPRHPTREPD